MVEELSPVQKTLYKEVQSIIDALPQRSVIADSTVDSWIRGVIKRDPDRAIWHAYRAGGLGGSEVGELLLNAMGQAKAYNSLEELSKMKLLQQLPGYPTIHMRRGTEMEPLAELVYAKITGHKSLLETPEIKSAFMNPHPQYPFMVGNPDEVALVGENVLITDFKVRSNLDAEDSIKIINASQVHWYGLLYEGHFKKLPDYYALAELDIPSQLIDSLMDKENPDFEAMADNIASVNGPGFGMQIRTFHHNPTIAKNLIRLASQFWENHVMTGMVYQDKKPEKPTQLTPADERKLDDLQNQFLKYKLASQTAKDKSEEIRADIDQIASKYEIKDWPFDVPGIAAGYSERFDPASSVAKLVSRGVNRESLLRPGKTLDADAATATLRNNGLLGDHVFKPEYDTRKIKAALKEAGIDVKGHENQVFRIGISTKKVDSEIRHGLLEEMSDHIKGFRETDSEKQSADATDEEELIDWSDPNMGGLSLA